MSAETEPQHFRWSIGSSIAEELDFAMYAVRGRFLGGEFPVEYGSLLRTVPPIWRAELDALLGEPGGTHGVLEPAAFLAGTLLDDDYSRATLAVRELSAEAALERLRETAQQMGVEPDLSLPFEPRLADLFGRMEDRTFREAGFAAVEDESQIRRRREELLTVARLLAGGDLHARFWHWLDRFYYELYRPWRASQAGHLEDLERRARVALGSSEGGGQPDLSWLPPQNPLKMRPALFDYARSHGARLHFWVEPFGVADSFALLPGLVLVSFATPGAIYENFQAFAADVASRAAALADPTRLIILRLIRQYGMINTEIASFLGLARPTVSIHARILREAGLIRSAQEGRLVRHEMV
ncbi:MAG TPA: winged helix-turn-helix domain-containing protein, partial [Anaerolineaceae bacterium]